jgi:hypothetical protein
MEFEGNLIDQEFYLLRERFLPLRRSFNWCFGPVSSRLKWYIWWAALDEVWSNKMGGLGSEAKSECFRIIQRWCSLSTNLAAGESLWFW